MQIVFGRRVRTPPPDGYRTRVKSYLTCGRAFRIETVVDDTADLGVARRIAHLPEILSKASISLFGAYEHIDPDHPAPRFGHPKDWRPDSGARAHAAAIARTKKLDRARDELDRLGRGLGGRHYPDQAAVTARIAAITRDRRLGPYLRTTVDTDPATGRPTLAWSFDQTTVLADEAATDGWYALLTTLPTDITAAEVLRRYKGQEAVERRYGTFKGPLAVAPMFLHDNRRITALITVICLALLVFCLVERHVRRAIAPATALDGLGPGHRPATPTGRLIFGALARLRLIPATNGRPAIIPRPGPLQARLLDLLDVDPTRPP